MKKALVLLSGLAVALALGHPWSCYHGDPQHSGRSQNVVGAPLSRVSAYRAGGEVQGSPVVRQDGNVLVGAKDVKLYCLDPDLDSAVWIADLTPYGSSIYYSSPALDDSGNAYITTSGKLVKVSTDGAVLWAWPTDRTLSISHSPVVAPNGDVFFACYSESLYAVKPDGTLDWARSLENSVNSAPAISPDGHVCVATTRGTGGWSLWAWTFDGTTSWQAPIADEADFASPAAAPDSTVYFGAGRYLYAVGPGGVVKWRDSLPAMIQSCPAVANESTLYVVAGSRLYCIDTDSGVRWRKSIGGSSNYCSPAVDAEGNVYVGTAGAASSVFYCIGPDSTVRDSHALSDDIWSSPAVGAGGRVYFGCMNDSIYLFTGPGAAVAEPHVGARMPSIRLLPNLTHGVLRLAPAGRYAAKVFDIGGSLVAVIRDADEIDLRELRRGVYLVQVAAPGCAPQKVVLH